MAETHPYIPKDLDLPGFVPNFLSTTQILLPFAAASLISVLLCWAFSGRYPKLSTTDRIIMSWWALTGLIHVILEGYFAFSPAFFQEKTPFYLAEVWKEYSKGDSRYAARDPAVVTVEGITAVLEGPAALLAVFAIAWRKPYRHALQLAVCLGQLYGCLVYFITAYLQGDNFATSPFYFWAYYIGANSPWTVIPALIAARSWRAISAEVSSPTSAKKRA